MYKVLSIKGVLTAAYIIVVITTLWTFLAPSETGLYRAVAGFCLLYYLDQIWLGLNDALANARE